VYLRLEEAISAALATHATFITPGKKKHPQFDSPALKIKDKIILW
jgi:hypothetical protein